MTWEIHDPRHCVDCRGVFWPIPPRDRVLPNHILTIHREDCEQNYICELCWTKRPTQTHSYKIKAKNSLNVFPLSHFVKTCEGCIVECLNFERCGNYTVTQRKKIKKNKIFMEKNINGSIFHSRV